MTVQCPSGLRSQAAPCARPKVSPDQLNARCMGSCVLNSQADPETPAALLRLRGGVAQEETYTVTFRRKANIGVDETLYVLGDCAVLGDMAQEKGIAMKKDTSNNSSNTWTLTVDKVPMGARYVYMASTPANLAHARHLTHYRLQLHAGLAKGAGALLADDTTQLVRFEVNKGAGDVRVTGSAAALGGWDYDSALKLEKSEHNKWQVRDE